MFYAKVVVPGLREVTLDHVPGDLLLGLADGQFSGALNFADGRG
jgi:hypothetical protein